MEALLITFSGLLVGSQLAVFGYVVKLVSITSRLAAQVEQLLLDVAKLEGHHNDVK